MNKFVLPIAAVGVLVASSGFAADIPVAPVYKAPVAAPAPFSWTGFYLGGFGGVGTGSEDPSDINQYGAQGVPGINPASHIWAYKAKTAFIGGGTIGYNYQVSSFVFGVEGEVGYIGLKGSGPDPRSPGMDVLSSSQLNSLYELIAGRAGVAWDRALFYAKAGAVFTSPKGTVLDTCTAMPCGPLTISATGSASNQASWVAGGGIEYALTNNWSVKAEYLYWSLQNHFNVTGIASNGQAYTWDHWFSGLSTFKVGANFRF